MRVFISPTVQQMMNSSKPLPASEQMKLLKEAREGSERAKNELIKCNCRFVYKVVSRYNQPNIEFDDLFHEGLVGLNIAINRFDFNSKNNFMTYAIFWIRERASRHVLKNLTNIKLPENYKDREIYNYVGIDDVVAPNGETFSNHIPQETFDNQDDEQYSRRVREIIEMMMDELTESEKHVIKGLHGFYGDPMLLREFKRFNISKYRAAIIRDKALEKIKNSEYLEELREVML